MTYHDVLERAAYFLVGVLIVLLVHAARTCQNPFLRCAI
jgi:hypothetical protein